MAVTTDTARLNLGCGDYPLAGFLNVDACVAPGVDIVLCVPPLPWPDRSVVEIYMGHFLEHLDHPEGMQLLRECARVLVSGGILGVVVPDFEEIARRYVMGDPAPFEWQGVGTVDVGDDLDELCRYLLFSTIQPSHHRWAYDLTTLGRALGRAGLEVTGEIDRLSDPRLSTPRWYQCGLEAVKR